MTADNSIPATSEDKSVWQRSWPWLRRLLTLAFFSLILWLLVSQARTVDWQEVKNTLLSYSRAKVALAIFLSLAAFAVYSCYDLFGRHYIKSSPSKRKSMVIAFISFAFNLNFGALVGSVALRYRMYSRLGLGKGEIAHVVGMTVTTNWLGYLLLSGIAFASGRVTVPFDWDISNQALRLLGVGFIGVVATYLLLCRFSRKRTLHIRDHELTLPRARIALTQLAVASTHWLLIGSVIYIFLHGEIDFPTVFGVLLVSSIAGAVAHIPGALGVLEAVFITLLGNEVPKFQLVAALIAYRAVFYILPLCIALLMYLYMEIRKL